MRLLDLFCGAGGAAAGYELAGITEIVGVDIVPRPNYPFEFIQADALTYPLDGFDIIHASPPCQRFAVGTPNPTKHPDLIGATRQRLVESGVTYWVIENVPRAPIRKDLMLCGSMFGLGIPGGYLRRHRHFELHGFTVPQPTCKHGAKAVTVTGTGCPSGTIKTWGRVLKTAEFEEAMGIDWMTRKELSEAIPPAYTQYIGKHLLDLPQSYSQVAGATGI